MEKHDYPGSGTAEDPFVVSFAEGDPANPKAWAPRRKWGVLLIYGTLSPWGLFSISSYTSGFAGMMVEFGTTTEILSVGEFLYLFGLACGSLIWPAMGDALGRQRMAVGTLAAFAGFSCGTAGAQNIGTVLVSRFFSGFFSAGIQTLGPACLSSLFEAKDLAIPFTVAAICPFLGPSVGPLVGGYVTQDTGSWRNINWVAVGFAGVMALLSILVPEIHGPTLLRAKAEKLSKSSPGVYFVSSHDVGRAADTSFKAEAQVHLVKPFAYLLKEPIALLFSAYLSFLYAILQIFFTAFPIIYQVDRGWSQGKAGLPYIALIVGYFLAVPVTKLCTKPYLKRLEREGYAAPEHRLYFAMLAAVLLPISLFWMGWTARPSVHWANPVIAGGIFGFAQIGIMMSVYVFFADVYTVNVGAVLAGMNFLRFGASSVFPLFATQLYTRLGVAWACSLIAFLLLLFLPIPFVFYHWGPTIRSKSRLVTAKPTRAREPGQHHPKDSSVSGKSTASDV